MDSIIKYVVGEMRVIAGAPSVFIIALLVLSVAIWWFMDWRYNGIIANKDSDIASLKLQRDDYKDKLGGATPDQAKARIDALEARLSRVEPRHLTDAQIADLINRLRNGSSSIRINADMACADCGQYKGDLVRVFHGAAGWQVLQGSVMGPNDRPASGLGLRIQNPQNPTIDEKRIIDAFRASNIRFDLQPLAAPPNAPDDSMWRHMELLVVGT